MFSISANMYKNKRKSYAKPGSVKRTKKAMTTSGNRQLIEMNASAIQAVRRLIPPPIYTDWQYTFAASPFINNAPSDFFTLEVAELMSPVNWDPVLRQDENVVSASSTLVKRLQLNLRYSLGQADWCQMTTFVVTIRKDANDRTINQAGLEEPEDYIYSRQNFNPRLNSNVFKVHHTCNKSLMTSSWQENAASASGSEFIGNPNTTWGFEQVSMNLDYNIRQPNGQTWGTMNQAQLPPEQRMYLLMFFKGKTESPDDNAPRVDWDALYTCLNSS